MDSLQKQQCRDDHVLSLQELAKDFEAQLAQTTASALEVCISALRNVQASVHLTSESFACRAIRSSGLNSCERKMSSRPASTTWLVANNIFNDNIQINQVIIKLKANKLMTLITLTLISLT